MKSVQLVWNSVNDFIRKFKIRSYKLWGKSTFHPRGRTSEYHQNPKGYKVPGSKGTIRSRCETEMPALANGGHEHSSEFAKRNRAFSGPDILFFAYLPDTWKLKELCMGEVVFLFGGVGVSSRYRYMLAHCYLARVSSPLASRTYGF